MTIQDMIRQTAARYRLDPNLALAVARAESGYNQNAVSPVGAIGVFQLMPKTAEWLGVDPYNLKENIDGGVRYLSQLIKSYGGDLSQTLAAYNWGSGNLAKAIAKWGSAWLSHAPLETRKYIPKIFGYLGITAGTETATGERPPPADTAVTIALLLLGGALLLSLLD